MFELFSARMFAASGCVLLALASAACSTLPTRDRPALAEVTDQPQAERLVILMYPDELVVRPSLKPEPADDEHEEGIEDYVLDLLWNRATKPAREHVAAPARQAFDSIAFAEQVAERLQAELHDDLLTRDVRVQIETNPLTAIRGLQRDQNNLMISITAGFNYSLEGFFVASEVSWTPVGKPSISTRYVSEFVNSEHYGKFRLFERRASNAAYWSANGGAALQRTLAQAADELAQAIATDFKAPQPIPGKSQPFYSYAAEDSPHKVAAVLARTPTRVFVVSHDGQYWLDRIQIERPRLRD